MITIKIRTHFDPTGFDGRGTWEANVDMLEDGSFRRGCNAGGTNFHKENAITRAVTNLRSHRRHHWSSEDNERVATLRRGRNFSADLASAKTPLELYRALESALQLLRAGLGVGTIEEAPLIDDMATVWWELGQDERDMLDAEGPVTFPLAFPDPSR